MGKVAKIVDPYTVVVTIGSDDHIDKGDILAICDNVIDPETGDDLGWFDKVRVKVTEVFPRFCVGETYRIIPTCEKDWRAQTVTVNIGDDVRFVNVGV